MKLMGITTGLALLGLATMPADAQQIVLKLGHGAQTGHQSHIASVRLAELIGQRSNGAIKLEVYPDRQLGEEREMVEGLQIGSVDLAVVSTGPLLSFSPDVGVLDLPFLFKDSAHVYRVLDGEVGKELLGKFGAKNIIGLAWWENGWRHLTTKKPIAQPSDLKGLKLRTMQNPVHIAAFKELGAAPVPMAWGEVFTSLGQGVIDGQENPVTIIYTNALWEVQKNLTLTGHVYSPHAVLMSRAAWNKLNGDQQALLTRTVAEVTTFQRETSKRLESEQLKLLQDKGMAVAKVDLAPFQAATREVASTQKNINQDLLAKVRAAAN
jgi:TRAP-type transport system periplasmic protein